jgi:hypothetical protein
MKRHSTDMVSLVFGLIFAAIAGWWALGYYLGGFKVNIPHLGLFAAGALIVLGLLGVAASLRRDRTDPVEAPVTAVPVRTDDGPDTDQLDRTDRTDRLGDEPTAATLDDLIDPPPSSETPSSWTFSTGGLSSTWPPATEAPTAPSSHEPSSTGSSSHEASSHEPSSAGPSPAEPSPAGPSPSAESSSENGPSSENPR